MQESAIKKIWLEGEWSNDLWICFNVSNEIKVYCEKELAPKIPHWSKNEGDIRAPYENDEFSSFESPIVGDCFLNESADEDSDFSCDIAELIDLAHQQIDADKAAMEWMLGTSDLSYYELNIGYSYNSHSLKLAENKEDKVAYIFFENNSGKGMTYSGSYEQFDNVDLAREKINQLYESRNFDDFALLMHFYRKLEEPENN
jgi:hypothetical protein